MLGNSGFPVTETSSGTLFLTFLYDHSNIIPWAFSSLNCQMVKKKKKDYFSKSFIKGTSLVNFVLRAQKAAKLLWHHFWFQQLHHPKFILKKSLPTKAWTTEIFPLGQLVGRCLGNKIKQEYIVSTPGSGRSPREGNGNPLQYSGIIPWIEEPGGLSIIHEVAKSQIWLSNWAHRHTHIYSRLLFQKI